MTLTPEHPDAKELKKLRKNIGDPDYIDDRTGLRQPKKYDYKSGKSIYN